MSKNVVTLDVREDLQRGREPFSKIMRTVAALKENEDLLLIAPFEPAPLFGMLAQQGFTHTARTTPAGDCEVLFTRDPVAAQSTKRSTQALAVPAIGAKSISKAKVIDVDARGLEPPQPLVKILEALAALPPGSELSARTDRRPLHLYAQLEERGFIGETQELKEGFVTRIRRRLIS
jgi:uncharacterized protein (DUF2249 family)